MENNNTNNNQRKSISLRGNEYIQAKKEYENGNWEMSLTFINLAIAKSERAIYFFFRGNIYEKLNNLENCYEDYKKAKDLNKTDYTYYENLGRVCKEMGRYEESIDFYKQIIEAGIVEDDDTTLANYHYEIGSIYDILKNYEESYLFYIQAIDLDNKSAVNYQYKGNYLHQCQEFKSKLYQLLETSYFYDVNSSKIFVDNDTERPSLSVAPKKDALEEQIEKLKKDVESKPFERGLWEKLAKNLKEAKRYDEAIVYFEKIYERQKTNKLCLIKLADCYLKIKNFKKAIFYADKLIQIDNTHFKTYKIISIAYYELNDMEKALDNISKAISIQPENHFSREFKKKIEYNLETNTRTP